ncbi:MAG TPA: response regulator transcription factor [Candidatus Baltobacteraceae bacterium]|nr:response regulator transcription factor [Candidatus Baltobacteraceae bacterium]
MRSILIVEDEPDVAELVKFHLEKEGYAARVAPDGKQAIEAVEREHPDLVILDLMLPFINGLDVCRQLKSDDRHRTVPIIMLTAKTEEVDRIVGLEMGADDYVCKPFSPRELIARVKAVLRRSAGPQPATEAPLTMGGLRVYPSRHQALRGGKDLDLSAMEFRLLEFFLRHRGRVYTRTHLLSLVWGQDRTVEARTVDVHIRRLREKIEPDPRNPELILTVRGVGYKACDREEDVA